MSAPFSFPAVTYGIQSFLSVRVVRASPSRVTRREAGQVELFLRRRLTDLALPRFCKAGHGSKVTILLRQSDRNWFARDERARGASDPRLKFPVGTEPESCASLPWRKKSAGHRYDEPKLGSVLTTLCCQLIFLAVERDVVLLTQQRKMRPSLGCECKRPSLGATFLPADRAASLWYRNPAISEPRRLPVAPSSRSV